MVMVMLPNGEEASVLGLAPPSTKLACVGRADEAGADGDAEVPETLADVIAAVIAASGSSGAGGSGRGTQSARRSSHMCPSGGRPGGCRVMPAAASSAAFALFDFLLSAARRSLRCSGVSFRGILANQGGDTQFSRVNAQYARQTIE